MDLLIYPSIHLFIHLFIYLSIYSSIHQFINSSIHPSISPCIHRLIHPFNHLLIHSSIHLPIHLSIHPTFHLSIYFYLFAVLSSVTLIQYVDLFWKEILTSDIESAPQIQTDLETTIIVQFDRLAYAQYISCNILLQNDQLNYFGGLNKCKRQDASQYIQQDQYVCNF